MQSPAKVSRVQFAAQASGNVPLAIAKKSYPLDLYPTEPFTPQGLKL
ncbi:hypothetical protein [Nostoc sp.]